MSAHDSIEDPPALPEIDHFGEPLEWLIPIPIEDNGEPLVDVFDFCPELKWLGKSPRFDFPRFGTARLSVAKMLAHAQGLLPNGLSLLIVGAFRPFETQKAMYDIVRAEQREKNPHWSEEFLTQYVNVFSAPPIWDSPPPHTTGGAVDLGIVNEKGERLDFTSPFEMGWDSAPTYIEGLSPEARKNRDLLIDVLTASGLTNFRGEWWHWSYGEPGWALRGGHPVALYGAVPDDQIPHWTAPESDLGW
jgi:D-alanyl-D-alanine dipeptidase